MNPIALEYIQKLEKSKDWCALLQAFVVFEGNFLPLEAAIRVLKISNTSKFQALVNWLEEVGDSPRDPPPSELDYQPTSEQEELTFEILAALPLLSDFDRLAETPPEKRSKSLQSIKKMIRRIDAKIPENNPEVLASYNGILAKGFLDQDDVDQALFRSHTAIRSWQVASKKGDFPYHHYYAKCLNNHGLILVQKGAINDAISNLDKALKIWQSPQFSNHDKYLYYIAGCANNLGNLCRKVDQHSEALSYLRISESAYVNLSGKDDRIPQSLAMCLNNLGNLLTDLGRYPDAVSSYKKALKNIDLSKSLPSHLLESERARILGNLGGVYSKLKKPRRAKKVYTESFLIYYRLRKKGLRRANKELARISANLGIEYRLLGSYKKAILHLNRALTYYESPQGKDPLQFARSSVECLNTLGLTLRDCDRIDDALSAFQKALALIYLLIEHKQPFSQYLLLKVTYHYCHLKRRTPSPKRGLEHLHTAISHARKALDIYDAKRREQKSAFDREVNLRDAGALAGQFASALLELANRTRDKEIETSSQVEALLLLDKMRSPRLVDVATNPVVFPSKASKEQIEQFREAKRNIQWSLNSYLPVHGSVESKMLPDEGKLEPRKMGQPEKVSEIRFSIANKQCPSSGGNESPSNLEQAKTSYLKVCSELRKLDTNFEPDQSFTEFSYKDLQCVLSATSAVVTIDAFPDGFSVFIVTRSLIRSRTFSRKNLERITAELSDNLLAYLDAAQQLSEDSFSSEFLLFGNYLSRKFKNVRKLILEFIATNLPPDIENLIFSADPLLSQIPFHALPLKDGKCFVDDYTITYTPSISVFLSCYHRKPSGGIIVKVSNPTGDLPFSEIEGELCWSGEDALIFLKKELATREAILSQSQSAKIFHYSGHSEYSMTKPLTSCLVTAGNQMLTLEDCIERLNLFSCKLAIINGCESSLGIAPLKLLDDVYSQSTNENPENKSTLVVRDLIERDPISFANAFLIAGARATIAPTWIIWDISSALIMWKFSSLMGADCGDFKPAKRLSEAINWLRNDIVSGEYLYKHILPLFGANLNKESFVIAKNRCRKYAIEFPDSPPFSSPAHWASFILTGYGL